MHSLSSSISRNLGRHLHSKAVRDAALDRYGLIRSFFSHVSSQPRGILPRCPNIYPNPLTASFTTSRAERTPTTRRPSLILKFARTYNTLPEQPSKDGNKLTKPPEDLKSPPPEDQTVGGSEHGFPHARDQENYSRFFQRLALSLPHLHRPTRDDFLNVATGFWQRLRIRFKWFTVRGFRKFNADDISAFITWFLFSQTLWILVGTYV